MDVVKFAPTGDQLHELSLAAERLNEKEGDQEKENCSSFGNRGAASAGIR